MPTLRELAAAGDPIFELRRDMLFERFEKATIGGAPNDCWPNTVKVFNFAVHGQTFKLRPHQVAYWRWKKEPLHDLLEISRRACSIQNCVNPYHFREIPARNTRMDANGTVHPLSEEEIEARRAAAEKKRNKDTVQCYHCHGTGRLKVKKKDGA